MPDRYGEAPEPEQPALIADPEMHAIALTVGCRYCNAQPGQPCINHTIPNKPATRIPHPQRINDAEEVPF